ncbi:MltA domain-containing protein [Poseidonibacter lekithochrous]|uniref:murein transglycosylase A n=1 Tax=Poseidonibacter TaxID=2321187 RepID=UPI001C0A390C|nr:MULTISPECIES: MltA domain-containing protein [Poseidonibacter]MBU3015788.1 MltA domain-containing protein [Poseidonibacter lekithochrous]MDO6829088.1 MltA domain-containing protein [Poseidonibacter sp. 1_MG-2023]
MKHYLLLLLSFIILGCSNKEQTLPTNLAQEITKTTIPKTEFDYLNGFYDDDLDLALTVFKEACTKSIKKDMFKEVCENSQYYNNGQIFFTKYFTPKVLVSNSGDKGLITGYFEPLLYGSRIKDEIYKYPVYKTPKDLITIKNKKRYPNFKRLRYKAKIKNGKYIPYDSREEIEKSNNFEIICYVSDPIDLFFMQIQGSGRVQLNNGETINIGYADQNGRKYFAIGKHLIDEGYLTKEEVSLQSIKEFLESNPSKMQDIMNLNESYVFFHESPNSATGSLNVPLIAKRNIAVDRNYIPLGMPVFLETFNPKTKEPINKLVVAADTGGAIKGEIRADYFMGFGKEAKELAGLMKEEGRLHMLIPKI